ncbi:MAG: mannitol dehydrogenase family protein [Ancrocorticia sp.]|jgi:fructuronate reductase|nr:mannitol dehydrogenase family protein [Ancrocorticia sp.]MCI1932853.1 mannitol dehydrogenase family protein [Ancrocorticia sp.]MCI2178200.1 mannitol dehydrogenase family protein [Ancrocorticia sp.]MCI2194330.1 mannitol dehydrogenase family protein [Ancrocorticia sp.]MCI2199671.1 mannitol dehydrogenase family protein [Ancrocorticia sp.]
MRLNCEGLADTGAFTQAGIVMPSFDVQKMQEQGSARPRWIHFGPGNIFRVFLARLAQQMIEAGHFWPVTAVVPLDPNELDIQLKAHDLMSLGVILHEDGTQDRQVIAGISEGLAPRRTADFERLVRIAENPEVTLVSFTITEKGYAVKDSAGALLPVVRNTFLADPHVYQAHTMALVASLLLHRFESGAAPITLMSCDNFSHNGDVLKDSILTIVEGWHRAGTVSDDFVAWVKDRHHVGFPISVIDKITPRPNASIAQQLKDLGFEDMEITMLGRTPLAGFVNSEPTEYLIVEDAFAAERPPFEETGVIITDRSVCDDFEHMKVTTCLNPLHTALAVSGCLLRFHTIDEEMRDPALSALVHRLGWDEGLPVVVDPGIVSPAKFLHEVLDVRFPNPYLPDDPARIAMDTSQKIPIRFGETIKAYIARGLDLSQLTAMPLVFALWCRYLMGIADDGAPFVPSTDPLLDELMAHVAGISLGDSLTPEQIHETLAPILSNPTIFAVDLYTTPLGKAAEKYFGRLIAGVGAVRKTLDEEMHVA